MLEAFFFGFAWAYLVLSAALLFLAWVGLDLRIMRRRKALVGAAGEEAQP